MVIRLAGEIEAYLADGRSSVELFGDAESPNFTLEADEISVDLLTPFDNLRRLWRRLVRVDLNDGRQLSWPSNLLRAEGYTPAGVLIISYPTCLQLVIDTDGLNHRQLVEGIINIIAGEVAAWAPSVLLTTGSTEQVGSNGRVITGDAVSIVRLLQDD